mgnify:FL=1
MRRDPPCTFPNPGNFACANLELFSGTPCRMNRFVVMDAGEQTGWKIHTSHLENSYPSFLCQTFNAAPRELVLTSSYLTSSCVDGANAGSPTCGWFRDEAGNNVPDSQGFCCSCSLASVIGLAKSHHTDSFPVFISVEDDRELSSLNSAS